MGRKDKLRRFAEVATFSNVFEHMGGESTLVSNGQAEPWEIRGKWANDYFKNNHSLIIELACGKGEYTLALAQEDPNHNYVGVDIKGARIWKGARKGLDLPVANAAFLRTRIEFIEKFFVQGEVEAIWITFPDPFERKPNRRLTSPPFLDRYRNILNPSGKIHLKTDSPLLFEFTMEVIQQDPRCKLIYAEEDIYSKPLYSEVLNHKTYYEMQHLADGKKITYIEFTIDEEVV